MATRDIASDLVPHLLFIAEGITSNTTTTSSSVDLANHDSGYLVFAYSSSYVDGTFTFSLQDSPDNSVWTDVPADKVIEPDGTVTVTALGAAGEVKRLGAFSTNRYVRLKVVSTGVTGGANIEAAMIKKAEERPELV
jgi:hypothetical protein